MKKRIVSLLLLFSLLLLVTGIALGQTYSFSLDEETVHAYWQEDGTLTLEYELVFTNDGFASPLDFVDIGLPTANFSDISASVDGEFIFDIDDFPYVTNGIALGLGANAIQPGDTGVVRARFEGIEGVLYTDSDDSSYASALFTPNWFGSEFVHGSTDLTVVYHMPPGVKPDEPRWHSKVPSGFPSTPATAIDSQGRVTYTWRNPSANGYTQYLFGASFPAQYVPASAITKPSFWQQLGIDPEALIGIGFFCLILFFVIGIPILSIMAARRRRMQYLPPKATIEGNAIKRGLSAVEAAILLEQPMDKILTMVLFAVVKKGAATVTNRDPLTLDVPDTLPKGLRKYETTFLEAFQEETKAKRRRALQKAMVALIKSVSKKMKGFSRRETTKYYKDIIDRAWAQVEAADTPEVKSEKYNEVMEWTMLDKDYDGRTREVFRRQPVFVPIWWNRYDPGYGRSSAPARTSGPSRPATLSTGGPSLPSLPGSDFAASVVNGVQNFSSGVVGSLTDFTSGVSKVTNPPPKPSPSSYRSGSSSSGGSSSCACACACAGCACACAGGGR